MIHPGAKNTPPKAHSPVPVNSKYTKDTLQTIREHFTAMLKSQCNVLTQYPVARYINLLQSYPNLMAHKYVGKRVLQLSKNIESTYSTNILETYHKLIMATLLEKQEQINFPFQLTPSLKTQYDRKASDILTGLMKHAHNQGWYTYDHEHFIYNLGICKKTTIPVGPFRLNLNRMKLRFITGATRRLGLQWYAREGKHLKRICIHRLPFIEMHLDMYDKDMGARFNPTGWEQLFDEVAEIMKINSELRYFVSMSWFFDPHLETISPELTYIRELVQSHGGQLIRFLPGESAYKNATRFHVKRAKLAKEGKYVPTNYLMIIKNNKML